MILNISWSLLKPQHYSISMMTDINMNDFLTRQYFTMGHSVRLSILFPLRRVNTNISQVHSRVWGHMGGGLTLKLTISMCSIAS